MHLTNQRHPRLHLSLKNNSPAEMDRGAGDHGGGPGCAEGAHHGLVETEGCILIDGLRSIGCSTKADPRTWHRHRPRRGAHRARLRVPGRHKSLHAALLHLGVQARRATRGAVSGCHGVCVCLYPWTLCPIRFILFTNRQQPKKPKQVEDQVGPGLCLLVAPFALHGLHHPQPGKA